MLILDQIADKSGSDSNPSNRNLDGLNTIFEDGNIILAPSVYKNDKSQMHLLGWPSNLLMVAYQQTISSFSPRPIS